MDVVAGAGSKRWRDEFLAFPLWRGASPDALERLLDACTIEEYPKGEFVAREGRRADHLAAILTGEVRGVHYESNGRHVVVDLLGPGALLGMVAVLADVPYEADAQTTQHTVIAAIPLAAFFDEFLASEPEVALAVLGACAQRWFSALGLARRSALEVPNRIALYLRNLPRTAVSAESYRVTLPTSRVELAAFLATTPETLSRAFHRLADEGVLTARDREVVVLDDTRLEHLASGGHGDDPRGSAAARATIAPAAPGPYAAAGPVPTSVPEELAPVLRDTVSWIGMPTQLSDSLMAEAVVKRYAPGDAVIVCGTKMSDIGLVLEGQLRAARTAPGGKTELFELLGVGATLGVASALSGDASQVDVEAIEPSTVAWFSAASLRAAIIAEPALAHRLAVGLARRWVDIIQAEKRNSLSVPARLARYIVSQRRAPVAAGVYVVRLPVKRVELAALLAIAPETLSRVFRKLSDRAILEAKGQQVRVLDAAALDAVANGETVIG